MPDTIPASEVREQGNPMAAHAFRLPFAAACALAAALAFAAPAQSAETPARPAEAAARGPVTNLPLPRFVSMRAETANARRGPSLSHRVDWTFLRRGLPLEITGEYDNWRRVRDAEGAGGWVHYTLLSSLRTALVRGDAPVGLHAAASEAAPILAFAEPGVVARVEACSAGWCELSADGVEGWAPRAAIWGVGPDETLE